MREKAEMRVGRLISTEGKGVSGNLADEIK